MAGERLHEKAVNSLYDRFVATFPTRLDAIESEQSLTAGTLPEPAAYIKALSEFDNRFPRLEFYDTGSSTLVERTRVYVVDCSVVGVLVGDADTEALELLMRRYITATRKTIEADNTLNGAVSAAVPGAIRLERDRGPNAQTVVAYELAVQVRLHDA